MTEHLIVVNSEEILIGLRFIFEKCAALGKTPAQWKMSKIIPLFKQGDPLNPESYRPIANLNHLGKIYEKLMQRRYDVDLVPTIFARLTYFALGLIQ